MMEEMIFLCRDKMLCSRKLPVEAPVGPDLPAYTSPP